MYVRVTMNKNIVDNIYKAWGNIVSNHEGIIKHVCEILSSYLFIDLVIWKISTIKYYIFFENLYIARVRNQL